MKKVHNGSSRRAPECSERASPHEGEELMKHVAFANAGSGLGLAISIKAGQPPNQALEPDQKARFAVFPGRSALVVRCQMSRSVL